MNTLQERINMNRQIEAHCECGHGSYLDLEGLLKRHSPNHVITGETLVCGSCGNRGARLSVSHKLAGKANLR